MTPVPTHTVQTRTFSSLTPGPSILIFGAIHGNEVCGPRAIVRSIREFATGECELLRGSVTFVPICNPLAYTKKVRFVAENLNRIFRQTKKPTTYEALLANTLCGLVDTCDILLDIHSTTARGTPFMYLDFPTARNRAWARVLGPEHAVVGWPELYASLGSTHTSFDTTTYAHQHGKDTLLVECGQHTDPLAHDVAHKAIHNTLAHYGLLAGAPKPRTVALARIYQAFFRHEGEELAQPHWRHLDQVEKGAPLIVREGRVIARAPAASYIIMPKQNAPLGQDWLYLGKAR